jgi:hypothetical protein
MKPPPIRDQSESSQISQSQGFFSKLLEGVWFRCAVQMFCSPTLALTAMEGNFVGGMSGSPIVSPEGMAIGVACLGAEDGAGHQTEPIGRNPSLLGNLPGWLLQDRAKRSSK